jgi:thymidylate kinase
MLWLHAAMADMAFETAVRIRALRFLGYTVICDRYVEESDMDLVLNFGERTAHMWAWRLVKAVAAKPDIRLLFDLPFGEALRRSILKKEPFPDPEEKRLLRAGLYENLKRESSYCVIDAQMSITEISALIDRLVAGEESLVHASTGVRP